LEAFSLDMQDVHVSGGVFLHVWNKWGLKTIYKNLNMFLLRYATLLLDDYFSVVS